MIVPGASVVRKKTTCFSHGPASCWLSSDGTKPGWSGTSTKSGGSGGLWAGYLGSRFGGGLFGRYAQASTDAHARRALGGGAFGIVGARLGERTFLGGILEAGLSAERAEGHADGRTASSNATLPVALRVADEKLGLPSKISRFVLTVGATANQNGTALFEGVTVLFLAQFFGVDLTLTQQVTVMFVCILGGIGTAGVPAGSLPVVALICGMVGVPPEGIGLILGVDRFLDMCRTSLNVTGDLATAVVVSARSNDAETPVIEGGGLGH